jgi:FkbM family methyltransferase
MVIDINTLRQIARIFPAPIRRALGLSWDYSMRLFVWRSILRHVRGSNLRDQLGLYASAVASPLTSLRKLGKWQDPALLWDITVQVHGIGSFGVRCNTDDLWHVLPTRERNVLSTIQKYLPAGGVFVDAGANIGVYTVLAARLVGDKGKVIAVEMMPETADILRRHLAMNHLSNVVVVQQALADASGKHVIARVPGGQHGQATIAPGVVEGGAEVRVETSTIADILAEVEDVSLMKMDLEGAEELALVGAEDALKRVRAVIFEDWGNERLSAIFRSKGFSVERLDGNNCLALNVLSRTA